MDIMKNVIIILFTICSIDLIAEWPEIGTKWYYGRDERPMGYIREMGYVKLEITKDTVIKHQPCKIMSKTGRYANGQSFFVDNYYILYKDNKIKIFQKDSFYTLYDFSLKVMDTLQITMFNPIANFKIRVDSVNYININGNILKKFYLSGTSGWMYSEYVIEKIGNLNYFFPQNELGCDAGACYYPLRCYFDSQLYYRNTSINCDTFYTNISQKTLNDFNIYPNPCSKYIIIEHPEFKRNFKIKFFNNLGNQMLITYVVNNNLLKLDVKQLNSGIYHFQLTFGNKTNIYKFIKL